MYTDEIMIQDTEKLYDLSYISKACRNSPDMIKKMVDVFIKTIPAAVNEIKQQYWSGDYAALKKTAHRIKPVILMYAIVKAEKVVLDIEMMAKNEINIDFLGQQIEQLEATVNSVVEALKKEFNT